MLVTTTIDAEPDHRDDLATESIIPLLLAMATGLFWLGGGSSIPGMRLLALGAGTVVLFIWFWTARRSKKKPQRRHGAPVAA